MLFFSLGDFPRRAADGPTLFIDIRNLNKETKGKTYIWVAPFCPVLIIVTEPLGLHLLFTVLISIYHILIQGIRLMTGIRAFCFDRFMMLVVQHLRVLVFIEDPAFLSRPL